MDKALLIWWWAWRDGPEMPAVHRVDKSRTWPGHWAPPPSPGSWPSCSAASGKRPVAAICHQPAEKLVTGKLKGFEVLFALPYPLILGAVKHQVGSRSHIQVTIPYTAKIFVHLCWAVGWGRAWKQTSAKAVGLGTALEHRPGKLHKLTDCRATRQWLLVGASQQVRRGIFIPGTPAVPGTSSWYL